MAPVALIIVRADLEHLYDVRRIAGAEAAMPVFIVLIAPSKGVRPSRLAGVEFLGELVDDVVVGRRSWRATTAAPSPPSGIGERERDASVAAMP
jgi:hypothetical protein